MIFSSSFCMIRAWESGLIFDVCFFIKVFLGSGCELDDSCVINSAKNVIESEHF